MPIIREVIPFRGRPDDWAMLQQLEQMINTHAACAGWPALSLHISVRDSRGSGCEASSVAEARDNWVGRRSAVSALTMTFSAKGGGHETSAARKVELRFEKSGSREVEIAGPDRIEVAGLAQHIKELVSSTGRGGPRFRRLRSLVDWLLAHIPLMLMGIVTGIATGASLVWLGLR